MTTAQTHRTRLPVRLPVIAIFGMVATPSTLLADVPANCTPNPRSVQFADTTGPPAPSAPGKADGIVINNDGIYVRPANSTSSGTPFLPNQKWTSSGFSGDRGTFFADVNGDGKADAIAVNNNDGIRVRLANQNGDGFEDANKWTLEAYYGTKGTNFADVNGDGKADAIAVNDDGIYVRLSNGSYFEPAKKWTEIGYWGQHFDYYNSSFTFFADVTGDGAADAIVINLNGNFHEIYVRRAFPQFSKFGELPVGPIKITMVENWSGPFHAAQPTAFADVNGDGKADAIFVRPDGVWVRLSDGSAFASEVKWTVDPYYGSIGTYFADVNGDGKADAIVINLDGVTVRLSTAPVQTFGQHHQATTGAYYGDVGPFCP